MSGLIWDVYIVTKRRELPYTHCINKLLMNRS